MSWDKHSIGAMARKAGDLYKALYLGGYAMPNLHVHATLISAVYLEGADEEFAAAARKQEAYSNLGQASAIMLLVMKEQNGLFKLGLDQELGRVHTIRSASTMSAKQRNARKTTSSFSKREKMRRKPFSLRKSRSISLRFL